MNIYKKFYYIKRAIKVSRKSNADNVMAFFYFKSRKNKIKIEFN